MIDGGSTLGEDAISITKNDQRDGLAVAIEFNPLNFVLLRLDIRYYDNIIIVNSAL